MYHSYLHKADWGETLLTGLAAYWKLDEASGTRADSVASVNLTDMNTVTSAAGKVGSAASFALANTEYLMAADTGALAADGGSFTWDGWIYLASKTVAMTFAAKDGGTVQREWFCSHSTNQDKLAFVLIDGDGVTVKNLFAASFGSPPTGTWFYVCVWFDASAETTNIQVNNGAIDSLDVTGVVPVAGTARFCLGGKDAASIGPLDGRIDESGFWRRVLTADERVERYNAGMGNSHPFESVPVSVSVSGPVAYQTYQRDTSTGLADIPVTGTYNGSVSAIEGRFNGGSWTTIDGSPTGGSYAGTLAGQSAGQGLLEVRVVNEPAVSAEISIVSIGDIYLVAGQSNASGAFVNLQSYTHPTLIASMFRENQVWAELTDPTDSDRNLGSAWPLLATSLLAYTTVPIAFVLAPDDGTGLVAPDADWTKPGPQYTNFINTVLASGINDARAILWHQGESDALNGISRADYSAALSQMLNDMQVDLSLPSLKLMSAQLGQQDSRTTDAMRDAIRLAQSDSWTNDLDILHGPVLFDVNLADEAGDSLHFKTNAEATILKSRWYRSILAQIYDPVTYKQAAVFASAVQVDGTHIDITFTVPASPLAMTAGDTIAWAVTDSGGACVVTDAQLQSATVVRLTVDTTLTAPITVSYASGNSGVGSSLHDTDVSGIAMPPQPFVDESVI